VTKAIPRFSNRPPQIHRFTSDGSFEAPTGDELNRWISERKRLESSLKEQEEGHKRRLNFVEHCDLKDGEFNLIDAECFIKSAKTCQVGHCVNFIYAAAVLIRTRLPHLNLEFVDISAPNRLAHSFLVINRMSTSSLRKPKQWNATIVDIWGRTSKESGIYVSPQLSNFLSSLQFTSDVEIESFKVGTKLPKVYRNRGIDFEAQLNYLSKLLTEDDEKLSQMCRFCKEPSKFHCKRCQAPYCSRKCQVGDWTQHKEDCKKYEKK
jgi:hypothetical protein